MGQFGQRFFREAGGGPDLAVGVRVRATHGGPLVLEYLHVCILRIRLGDRRRDMGRRDLGKWVGGGEVGRVDGGPCFHHREDFSGGHVGESNVVMVREG